MARLLPEEQTSPNFLAIVVHTKPFGSSILEKFHSLIVDIIVTIQMSRTGVTQNPKLKIIIVVGRRVNRGTCPSQFQCSSSSSPSLLHYLPLLTVGMGFDDSMLSTLVR